MRWYTLHPSLPTKAVLRIRTAPNSNASVCGRVAKGKAIAVRAPAFELPHDSPHATESRWLHVALEDEASGSMMEGFVMANLPDGTSLLIPWEEEGFMCCCRVKDARAILFESSEPDAAIVGSVDAGEGWQFPFGVLQVAQTRARIFHDVFESVWIDLTELEEVCAASQHYGCSGEVLVRELTARVVMLTVDL
ncbi:TPA: hypothetical protein N0F65_008123 [Lagenidium giganteum]|uniref:Uncharacterized protein n=1 Tax=Lagenidium giganteum TaxID=4803 RepID=A0AAV2YXZ7_9STRA|nr:TPA: hypothetical protein N0F65_008123 [Lagenidium giganteum]